MKSAGRTVLVTLVVVGTVAVWAMARPSQSAVVAFPATTVSESSRPVDSNGRPVGVSGCMAAACHGGKAEMALTGGIDSSTWECSGSAWVAADPHTAAYSLLTDHPHRAVKVTAKHIMARYAEGKPATEDARCLACHTNPALAEPGPTTDPHILSLRREGVSCEACHGNAVNWLGAHTTWTGNRRAEYAKTGMTPLFDIGERAMNCLGCHVGAPEDKERKLPVRDMNHDMIAAGHPRLNFDFAEYLRRLPPHWQEKDREPSEGQPVPRPLNPAKAWIVGRTAHAEAACNLLASRAQRSTTDERTPWPEFAEYNCAACHHNLRAASDSEPDSQWRKDPANLHGRTIGAPPWQTIWPMTPAAGLAVPEREDSPLKDVLAAIEVARPTRAAGATAGETATRLAGRRKQLVALKDDSALLVSRKWLDAVNLTAPDWDSGSQLLFGFAAVERAKGAKPNAVPPEFRTAFVAFVPPRVPIANEGARLKDERERWQKFHAALDTLQNAAKNRP